MSAAAGHWSAHGLQLHRQAQNRKRKQTDLDMKAADCRHRLLGMRTVIPSVKSKLSEAATEYGCTALVGGNDSQG